MNPSMYNDRNVLNGGQPRQENPSLSVPPQVWPAHLEPSTDHFPHQEQNSVPFYNPPNTVASTPYFSSLPSQAPTDTWPPWSNEQNNNNNNNPTIFQPPQNHSLNPQADPWQWSVSEPSGDEVNQWSNLPLQHLPGEAAEPSYEQYPAQMIPEQGYYYGQQPPQQWGYAEQPLDYETNSADNSWNTGSWNPSNEPSWNPIPEQPPNLNQSVMEQPPILDPAAPTVVQNLANDDIKEIPISDDQPKSSSEKVTPEIIRQPNVEESFKQEFPLPTDIPQNYVNQVDEPNQEVPEPVKPETSSFSSSPSHCSSVKLEPATPDGIPDHQDPPNEQILCKSDSPVTSVSSDKVVIKPWEGGPFQPPINCQNSNEIVQQELPETVNTLTSSLATLDLNKQPDDSANMETEPDNLEQPPDPNLNRINPHHIALHKAHFGEEQDSEVSNKTNLWEQPNLPNVLLLPAAVTDNLPRSGSPAFFNPVPPTIPVVIPSKENLSNATESSTISTDLSLTPKHSKSLLENVVKLVNSPLNLVELDRSPRRRPEFADKPQYKSNLREGTSQSHSPLNQSNVSQPLTEDSRLSSIDRIKRDNRSASREYDSHPRFREVEGIDSHFGNRYQYKNNRYDYDERNSRPSSRASEPVGNHYPSRYSEHGREFDNNGAPLRPSREGTPSRIGMSEDDLRRDRRSNDYRDFRGSNRSLKDDKDLRNIRDPRDTDLRTARDPLEVVDPRTARISRDIVDLRAARSSREIDLRTARDPADIDPRTARDPRDVNPRTARDPRDIDPRTARDPRDVDPRTARDPRDVDPRTARDPRDIDPRTARDPRDVGPRTARDPRDLDSKNSRDPRDYRDTRDSRDPRDYGDPRGDRNPPDPRDKRDYRDPIEGDYDRRSREREDYPDSRGYEDDRRQPYTRGGEDDYYNRNRGYKGSNGGYTGYDYYQQQDRYSMYYNYFNYPLNYNYGYYDELYRTNPKYREQVDNYRAYYTQIGYESDRMSAHSRSGRSSVNDDISKDSSRFQKDYDTGSEYSGYQASLTMDNSYNQQDSRVESVASPVTPERLTPVKFLCPHLIGKLAPGKLLTSTPLVSSITDTSLQIHDLQQLLISDNMIEDLKLFPGPLLSGQTHKNDVIQFCQRKITILQRNIEIPDRDSRILLWELLVLMLRQNGNVSGSDIAELLLKDRHISKITDSNNSLTRQVSAAGSSSSPSEDASDLPTLLTTSTDGHLIVNDSATPSPDEGIVVSQDSRLRSDGSRSVSNKETLSIEQITEKFTEYLLFGHKKDALEWASKHGLWGHALFLASKMDSRSYANIMTRFANSLPLNDPLQTLYQLMSGRQPYSVTRLADEKFGDWRVHLAMILSNLSPQPEVDCRSITTLGDTLAQRGCLSAAHFCYLMAQVDFGCYDQKSSKMVLLTASHMLPFDEFASNEAIQSTEIYEYAQSLANPNYVLTNLQPYKLIYASRLAEYGFLQESLHYCEIMSTLAQKSRTSFATSLLLGISEIAWKLKYYDPHYTQAQGELEEIADPEWFTHLLSMSKEVIPIQNLNKPTSDEQSFLQDTTLAPTYTETEPSWANNSTISDQNSQYVQQSYSSQSPNNEWNQNQGLFTPQETYPGSYGHLETQESVPQIGHIQETNDSTQQNLQQQTNTFNGESPTITLAPKSSFDYYGSVTTQFQERSDAPLLPICLPPPPPSFELTTTPRVTATASPPDSPSDSITHPIQTPPPSPSSSPPPLPPRPYNPALEITSSHERLLIQLCRESDSDFGDGSSAHSSPAKRSTVADSDYDDDTHALVPISAKSIRPRSPLGASGWLKSSKLGEKDKVKKCSPDQTSTSQKDFSKTMAKFQGVLRRRKFSVKNDPSFTDSSPDWSPRHRREKEPSPKASSTSLNVFGMLSSKKIFGKDNFMWKNNRRRQKSHGSTGSLHTGNSEAESDNSNAVKGILHKESTYPKLESDKSENFKKKSKKVTGRKPGTGSKPVVFGGTYPIDEPCLLQEGLPFLSESLLATRWSRAQISTLPNLGRNRIRRYQRTFPVDVPCCAETDTSLEHLKKKEDIEDSLDDEVAKLTAEGNLHLKVIKKQHLKKTMKHQSSSLDECSSPWVSPKKKDQNNPACMKKVSFKCVEVLSDSEIINRTSLQPATKTGRRPTVPMRDRQDSIGSVEHDRRGSSFSGSSVSSTINTSNVNSNVPSVSKPAPSKENTNSGLKKDQKGKPQASGGSSWFGKILGNLLPKGPNQMILPDDKNPAIVWDAKNSRWINTYDDDNNATDAAPLAPPKDSELKSPNFAPPLLNNSPNAWASPPLNASMGVNRFQKPKFKSMRQNYVDVLNTNNSNPGSGSNAQFQPAPPPPPVENIFQNLDSPAQVPNLFIPAPAPTEDGPRDFVTQGHIPVPNEGQNESAPSFGNNTPMFDPAEFSTAPKVVGDFGQKRSAGGYNMASRRAYPS